MLPCARTCARKRLQPLSITSFDLEVASEPLLFLYPRWFRPVATKAYHHEAPSLNDTKAQSIRFHNVHDESSSHVASSRRAATAAPNELRVRKVLSSELQADNTKETSSRTRVRTSGKKNKSGLKPIAIAEANSESAGTSTERSVYDPRGINGLELAERLSQLSELFRSTDDETLELSSDFLKWISGTAGENMWLYREGSSCAITVPRESHSIAGHRSVRLRGSARVRALAAKHLRRLQGEFSTLAQDPVARNSAENNHMNCAQPVLDEDATRLQESSSKRIPKPDPRTIRSFYDHVRSLTECEVPRNVDRTMHPNRQNSHQTVLGIELRNLFSDPDLKQYISSAALHLALQYTSRRTNLSATAGQLWTDAINAGVIPSVNCFNCEIARCLAVNNIGRLHYLLDLMKQFRMQGDGETWSLVIKSMNSQLERLRAVQFVVQYANLRSAHDRQHVAQALVKTEFELYLSSRNGIWQFAFLMRERLGKQWLSPSVIDEMLQQCLDRGNTRAVSDILTLARTSRFQLLQQSYFTLTKAVSRTGNIRDIISLIKSNADHGFPSTLRARQNSVLFRAAWEQRMFNTCRLAWRYAASAGHIRYSMQMLVVHSLAQNVHPLAGGDEGRANRALLASFVTGIDTRIDNMRSTYPYLTKDGGSLDPAHNLLKWTPNDGTRHEQMRLAHAILENDLNAWKRFKPMAVTDYHALLDKAYATDQHWHGTNLVQKASPAQVLKEAMAIDLEPRDIPFEVEGLKLEKETTALTSHEHETLHDKIPEVSPQSVPGDAQSDPARTRAARSILEEPPREYLRSYSAFCTGTSVVSPNCVQATSTSVLKSPSATDRVLGRLGIVHPTV